MLAPNSLRNNGSLLRHFLGCFALLTLSFGMFQALQAQEAEPAQAAVTKQEKIKVLLVDGQNNHGNWPQTSEMMSTYLTESGRFDVDVARTKPQGSDEDFRPNFSDYHVVLSNYNGASWPAETRADFVEFMKSGGGLVVVHAADNAFSDWQEYNQMIGLGGWGGRNEQNGPYVYYNESGEKIIDKSAGRGGSHGRQHEFQVIVRDSEHPVTAGMPTAWMHAQDELYDRLRGPASNMNILATSFADESKGGSGRHEPMVMTVEYGEGRVFHTTLGHGNNSQMCVGFITLLLRGSEWAATGEVTIEIPDDFPGENEVASRNFEFQAADK